MHEEIFQFHQPIEMHAHLIITPPEEVAHLFAAEAIVWALDGEPLTFCVHHLIEQSQ